MATAKVVDGHYFDILTGQYNFMCVCVQTCTVCEFDRPPKLLVSWSLTALVFIGIALAELVGALVTQRRQTICLAALKQ